MKLIFSFSFCVSESWAYLLTMTIKWLFFAFSTNTWEFAVTCKPDLRWNLLEAVEFTLLMTSNSHHSSLEVLSSLVTITIFPCNNLFTGSKSLVPDSYLKKSIVEAHAHTSLFLECVNFINEVFLLKKLLPSFFFRQKQVHFTNILISCGIFLLFQPGKK